MGSYLPSFMVSPFTLTVVLGLWDSSPLTPNTPLHTNRLLVGKNFWDSKSTLWWDGGCEAAHVWPGCQAEDWLSVLSLMERATQRDWLADRAHSPPPSPLEPLKGSQACAGTWSPGVTAGVSPSWLGIGRPPPSHLHPGGLEARHDSTPASGSGSPSPRGGN